MTHRTLRPRRGIHAELRNLGVLASMALHLAAMICMALMLGAADLGGGGRLELEVSLAKEIALPEPLQLDALDVPSVDAAAALPQVHFAPSVEPDRLVSPSIPGTSSVRAGVGSGPRGEFFGTVAYGDRFVYVLDISGSMDEVRNRANRRTRLDCAVDELLYSVEQLSPDQFFYVILFNYDTRQMFDEQAEWPQMIAATLENKRRLREWLADVRAGSGTDPREGLCLALRMKPSAVFLLSDGQFNGHKNRRNVGILRGNATAADVVKATSNNQIPIHTTALEDKTNRKRMEELSAQTGGEYRYIAPLPPVSQIVANRFTDRGANSAAEAAARHAALKRQLAKRRAERLADTLLRKAQRLEERRDYEAAATRYRRVLELYPDTAAADDSKDRLAALAKNAHDW